MILLLQNFPSISIFLSSQFVPHNLTILRGKSCLTQHCPKNVHLKGRREWAWIKTIHYPGMLTRPSLKVYNSKSTQQWYLGKWYMGCRTKIVLLCIELTLHDLHDLHNMVLTRDDITSNKSKNACMAVW